MRPSGPRNAPSCASRRRPRKRERQNPLPERHRRRQHVLDEIRRRRAHSPAHAGWTKSSPSAGECHQATLATRATSKAREASTQETAIKIRFKLLSRMLWQLEREHPFINGCVERLEIVTHDLV